MPTHILRLLVLLLVLGAGAYAAKRSFTVTSFYEYGHYRGNAVAQIAAQKPKFKGTVYCVSCHAPQATAWSSGVHDNVAAGKVVKCEVCHGPGGGRDPSGFIPASTGGDHPANMKMRVPGDTVALCTLCHQKLEARPQQQAQIVMLAHAGRLQCITCHDPHSPGVIAGGMPAGVLAGDATAGQAAAAPCAACHSLPPGGPANPMAGPRLDGQKAGYLIATITAYQAGQRQNPVMNAMVQGLSAADIRNIAAYFAARRCMPGKPVQAAAGDCIVCHGADGLSRRPLWPNLAGLSQAYFVAALQAYRDGTRKNPLMSPVAKTVSDGDAIRLAASFAAGSCP